MLRFWHKHRRALDAKNSGFSNLNIISILICMNHLTASWVKQAHQRAKTRRQTRIGKVITSRFFHHQEKRTTSPSPPPKKPCAETPQTPVLCFAALLDPVVPPPATI